MRGGPLWQAAAMHGVRARLQLERDGGGRVGPERVRLLRAIAERRSITGAAQAVGLSYRGAWDGVQALNALFGRPLVEARVGGRDGGDAGLTPAGQALLIAFERIDRELAHVVGQLDQHLADGSEPLDRMTWRLGLKTSARNTLPGVVETVTPGAVNSEVVIRVGEGLRITAIVTNDSAVEMELSPGVSAVALIKSSFVILAPGAEPLRTSARNVLVGRVVQHREGAVNDEVVLEVAGGLRITATITRESGGSLGFAVGEPAQALIKASHVIVAVD